MSARLFGILGTFWIVVAPFIAFWAMWSFAFKSETQYWMGTMIIAAVLIGPPLAMAIFYNRNRREAGNERP